MPQSGFTPLQIYSSSTASNVPSAANLTNNTNGAELAINIADGKLFYKDSSGNVQVIASKAGNINVSSLSFGTTGLTPNTATTGAITVGGTLVIANGGTGQTSFTAGYVLYGNGTSGLASSANMTFNGTSLTLANDASISGLTVGKGGGSQASNTAVGTNALNGNSTGVQNAAFGGYVLQNNTTNNNSGFGYGALASTTSGGGNVAFGYYAAQANTTGASNTAFGSSALQSNTTASNNTAVGYQAGYSNTTGVNNTMIGYAAGYSNTTSNHQTFIGWEAGYSTTGAYNTFVGSTVGYSNTTGNANLAIGGNYTGSAVPTFYNNTTGSNNTALGFAALASNTTASNNTAVGYQAGYSNTTATQQTLLGYQAGFNLTTQGYNTLIGYQSGLNINGTFGQNCFVGTSSGQSITSGYNNTIIGSYSGNQGGLDIRTASNYIVLSDGAGNPRGIFDNTGSFFIGTTSQTHFGKLCVTCVPSSSDGLTTNPSTNASYFPAVFLNNALSVIGTISCTTSSTAYNTSSDYRLKENVQPMTGALATVSQLKPVTYKWKADGSDGQGFIAHELQAVVPDCVTGEKDAVNEDGSIKPQGIDTSFLVATLTAAIQELNTLVTTQAAEIAALKAKLGA